MKVPAPKVTWDGTRLIVPDILMASWSESHPHVDLQAAIRKASSWCLANPGKRPKKDFARFLNGWFGRVKPGDPEYLDADERAASDAALIREVEFAIDDADERADYWYRCQRRGEYVPHGVDCRPMPDTIEEVRQAERKGAV